MAGLNLTDVFRRRRTGFYRCFHRADITPHHHGDEPGTNFFVTN
jgi:hypothetical protein